ncbi:MAG: pyocin knob domain-containing protein [Hafnia sp.]
MIIGFGNNTVSSLAADVTASQTTMQVMPGEGAKFSKLLSSDYVNTSNPQKVYAKITLTDAKETVFEVCHLTAVNNDMLTVVRGQEGTTAKGWALNDVVANFATRGSENQFVQIEQLQSGNYTSGVAGGSANALTIELPATYFINSSTDWALRTPIVVYPTLNNTGASTLQLVMGGRVLGTFPLYKGNKAQLVANDILKDVGLVCLMDKTKTFFNVANPGAIYAGLGTAAFKDVVTSMTDVTTGRVPVVGWMGLGANAPRLPVVGDTSYDSIPINLPTGFYTIPTSGGPFCHTITLRQDGGGVANDLHFIIPSQPSGKIALRWDSSNTFNYQYFYTDKNKPTASDVGAVSVTRKVNGHELNADVNVTSTDIFDGQAINLGANKNLNDVTTPGIYFQPMNANTSLALNYPEAQAGTLVVYKNAGFTQEYRVYNSSRIYTRSRYSSDAWTPWAKEYNTLNNPGASDVGAYSKFESDNKYQLKGNYALVGDSYTKSESDNKYQLKNTASKTQNGWHRDGTTGEIEQYGYQGSFTGTHTITFPIPFPNACLNVQATPYMNGQIAACEAAISSYSKTGVTIVTNQNFPVFFRAIGY